MPNVDEFIKDWLQEKHIIINKGYTLSHLQLKAMLLEWAKVSKGDEGDGYKPSWPLPFQNKKDKPKDE